MEKGRVKRFEEAHADIIKLVEELVVKKNISLLEIAGIMQATATRIYKEVLSKNKKIFFCLESICLKNQKDIDHIENIWSIKRTIASCIEDIR